MDGDTVKLCGLTEGYLCHVQIVGKSEATDLCHTVGDLQRIKIGVFRHCVGFNGGQCFGQGVASRAASVKAILGQHRQTVGNDQLQEGVGSVKGKHTNLFQSFGKIDRREPYGV